MSRLMGALKAAFKAPYDDMIRRFYQKIRLNTATNELQKGCK